MHNPIQSLEPKFLSNTLRAFARFLILHPLAIIALCSLKIIPEILFNLTPAPILLSYYAFLDIPLHMTLVSVAAAYSFSFLRNEKNTDAFSCLSTYFTDTFTFIRAEISSTSEHALPWRSQALTLLIVYIPIITLHTYLTKDTPSNQTLMDNAFALGFLFPLLLPTLWLPSFTHPIATIYFENNRSPLKIGEPLLCCMLLPVLKDARLPFLLYADILEQNPGSILLKALALWYAFHVAASLVGLAPVVDGFAFAALVHASMGGSLRSATASETSNANNTALTPQPTA